MRTATPLATCSRITESARRRRRWRSRRRGSSAPGASRWRRPWRARSALAREREELEVLAHRGEQRPRPALELHAQHHHHVGAVERLLEIVANLGTRRRRCPPASCVRGPASTTSAPSFVQQVDVGAHDAAVLDVADDRHLEPVDAPLVLADGEGVEQRLRRVLVGAVAGVDDPGACSRLASMCGTPGLAVADDDAGRAPSPAG